MKRFKSRNTISSRIKFGAFISILILGGAACGDTIELKSAVRLEADARVVTLADIANLEGPEAEALAEIIIATVDGKGGVLELPVRRIRALLDKQGVHWGRLQLNGRKVVVRPGHNPNASTLMAMQGATIDRAGKSGTSTQSNENRTAREMIDEGARHGSIRRSIARYMVESLSRSATDIQVLFNSSDEAFLDASLGMLRIEIQPMGTMFSDRLGLKIRLWDGARIVDRKTITIGLRVRHDVALPIHNLERNHRVGETDLRRETRWLKPSEMQFTASTHDVVGRITSRRLKAGEPISKRTVKKETIVNRGDLVTVRCLVGGSVISLQAESRDSGSVGDSIEFRKRGERATFLATISGPGEAIVDLSRH